MILQILFQFSCDRNWTRKLFCTDPFFFISAWSNWIERKTWKVDHNFTINRKILMFSYFTKPQMFAKWQPAVCENFPKIRKVIQNPLFCRIFFIFWKTFSNFLSLLENLIQCLKNFIKFFKGKNFALKCSFCGELWSKNFTLFSAWHFCPIFFTHVSLKSNLPEQNKQ